MVGRLRLVLVLVGASSLFWLLRFSPFLSRSEAGLPLSSPAQSAVETGGRQGPRAAPASAPGSPGLGRGFAVWESNRTGFFRLWRRELDGSGLRRLTPDDGLEHCCAHISPDGRRVAYLRYRAGQRRSGGTIPTATLYLMSAAGGDQRILAEPVRFPSELRAVTWIDSHRLSYIDAGGYTLLLDVDTGEETRLTKRPHPADGWLVDPTLSFTTSAWVTFSPFDGERGAVAEQRLLGGCQPYFSGDGRWGFWVGGAGGPIQRIDLLSREISPILEKHDPRLPADRGYLYFPMVSRDGALLAFGASPDEHDFARSDYDIFVVETDPATLEVRGSPVRLSEHPASDRFPDVFAEPLALGRHRGEAPFEVRFDPEGDPGGSGELFEWDFGDGVRSESAVGAHRFERAGLWQVSARRDGLELRGSVTVSEARPPRPVRTDLEGPRRVLVTFDEAIALGEARVTLGSGRPVEGWRLAADGRRLIVDLGRPVDGADTLLVAGVVDRAQVPNPLPPVSIVLAPPVWPADPGGLVFLWRTAADENRVGDPASGAERTYTLQAAGRGRLDRNSRMLLAGGAFVGGEDLGERMAAAARRTNRMSLELTLEIPPEAGRGAGEGGALISFAGRGAGRRNFSLEQRGWELIFGFGIEEASLTRLPGSGRYHLVVTYSPGRLRAYLDGEEVLDGADLTGDFFHWRRRPLIFGNDREGTLDWGGTLEGLAFYDRVLGPEEAKENARRYRRLVEARAAATVFERDARLVGRSEIPTLARIEPYREALVVYEYETLGEGPRERLRVAHWAILDGAPQPETSLEEGRRYHLRLEPFAENPQLEALYVSSTLPADRGRLYYSATMPTESAARR